MSIILYCKVCGSDNNTTQKINNSYFPNSHFSEGICSDDCFSKYNDLLLEKECSNIVRENIEPKVLIQHYDDVLKSVKPGKVIPVDDMTNFMQVVNGVKFDTDKVRWDLLPVEALEEVAKVYTFGAKKYSDRNWEKGLEYNRLYRAAFHHLTDFWMGKTKDEESNLHSLAHCAFNVLALLHFEIMNKKELDNRPKRRE